MIARMDPSVQGHLREDGSVLLRRVLQLYAGLVLFGVSCSMLILSALGNNPWDVLHQGLSRQIGLGTGWWAVILGVVVMLAWIPLRQRPGLGTISNVIVVGLAMQVVLDRYGEADGLAARSALMIGGVVLNGIACGMYIGARFGPGPRDGLMTGLAERGRSVRAVRTGIELTVLAAGIALGGTVGVGTVLYAVAIGPIVHVTLPWLTVSTPGRPRAALGMALEPVAGDRLPHGRVVGEGAEARADARVAVECG
jgi:uncharacterized membrane protein YczE